MTPLGYISHGRSEARRRIEATGEAFARERMAKEAAADRSRHEAAIELRRRKLLRGIETALESCRSVRAYEVVGEVCAAYGCEAENLLSPHRGGPCTPARFECWWRLHHELKLSLPRIGRLFSRHHTSILYGIRCHADRIEADG